MRLVHTGQHYDYSMSGSFFDQLGLPKPDINLGVGSSTVTGQTADIMKAYEPVFLKGSPRAVVVVGDVNSTLACVLTAVRYGTPTVHVEAGLRSFDRTMPEEINRVLTDQISDLLLITSPEARDNLLREGRSNSAVRMVATDDRHTAQLLPGRRETGTRRGFWPGNPPPPWKCGQQGQACRHPSGSGRAGSASPGVPGPSQNLKNIGKWKLSGMVPDNLTLSEPMDYLSFIRHQQTARVVITDSGGVQEEPP